MTGAVLHWDYENAPVPRGASVLTVLGEILRVVQEQFGPVYNAYVYADPDQLTHDRRQDFVASGLDPIDCKHTGKANTVDLRIVMRASSEVARPVPPGSKHSAAVVVTGDGDYAYTLSKLGMLGVDTMLVYDSDRMESVNTRVLLVATHTVGISFGGREQSEPDDAASVTTEIGEDGAPVHAAAATQSHATLATLSPLQTSFLLAIFSAPPADDEGFRTGPAVGALFHKMRNAREPTPKLRSQVYRTTCAQLLDLRRITTKPGPSGNIMVKALPEDP
jgi:hypothetical protein